MAAQELIEALDCDGDFVVVINGEEAVAVDVVEDNMTVEIC